MAHVLFNFTGGDRRLAAALLKAKMWPVARDGRDGESLAPGDLALVHLRTPDAEFIGRAELASAVHDWTTSEAEAYPGDSPSAVLLFDAELSDRGVPLQR